MDYSSDEKLGGSMDTPYKGKLDKRVQDLIKLIFHVNQMKEALVSMEIDINKVCYLQSYLLLDATW